MTLQYEDIKVSKGTKDYLEDLAKRYNTDLDNVIKILRLENESLKAPKNYITTTKISKNKSTFSTVIPAPIKNKFDLEKGQVLYWDIKDYCIIITPEMTTEETPEAKSITAGFTILNEMLLEDKANIYNEVIQGVLTILNKPSDKVSNEDKLEELRLDYDLVLSQAKAKEYQEAYYNIVCYLLDYPLDPNQNEVLNIFYKTVLKE